MMSGIANRRNKGISFVCFVGEPMKRLLSNFNRIFVMVATMDIQNVRDKEASSNKTVALRKIRDDKIALVASFKSGVA